MINSALGELLLVGSGDTVTGVYFAGHRPAPAADALGSPRAGVFAQAERELTEYLTGDRRGFEFPVAVPDASRLWRAVWERIAAIPYGETRSYRELALWTGSHPRAVGGAVAHNPLSIVIPCHRVIGARGALTGYAGGVIRKRALLALEAEDPGAIARLQPTVAAVRVTDGPPRVRR